jgi:acetyl-CoA carboxylase carboxyltransferase component
LRPKPHVLEEGSRRIAAAGTMAEAMDGPDGIERRQGKLTARERIAALADPGSFREFMALSGAGVYETGDLIGFTPKPFVNGAP